MNVLLTGGAGCLGTYLLKTAPVPHHIIATQFKREIGHRHTIPLDLRLRQDVIAAFEHYKPQVVIHTAYDKQDLEASVVGATKNVVDGAVLVGSQLIYISSDMVLGGDEAPYDETADVHPMIPYGRAKADAEHYITAQLPNADIIRTSLIIGRDPVSLSSQWIVEALKNGETVSLFTDELRCPILAEDLARVIWDVVGLPADERGGVWNVVGPDSLSRYEIGTILARYYDLDESLLCPARASELTTPRPRDLRMTCARARRSLVYNPQSIASILNSC